MLGGIDGPSPEQLAVILNAFLFSASVFLAIRTAYTIGVGRARLAIPIGLLQLFGPLSEVYTIRETALYSALILLFVCLAANRMSSKLIILSGIIIAMAMLTRPTGYAFIPVVLALIIAESEQASGFLKRAALLVSVIIVCVLPWQAYLSWQAERLVLTSSCTSGGNLLKGQLTNDLYLYEDVDELTLDMGGSDSNLCVSDGDLRSRVVSRVADNLSDDPVGIVRDSLLKSILFPPGAAPIGGADVSGEVGGDLDITVEISNFRIDKNKLIYHLVSFFVVSVAIVGAVVSLMFAGTFHARIALLFSGVVAMHTILYAITWTEARFAFPFLFVYLIFVSVVLDFFARIKRAATAETP